MPQTKFQELVDLMARLRGPQGCPWDKEQTLDSLKPMVLEEAYEVVEAIDEKDIDELCGELGDLLFQAVFASQIVSEQGGFNIADVIERIYSKMVRRHPHVFGNVSADSASEVLKNWEAIKAEEKKEKANGDALESMLEGVSTKLPAVMEAFQLTTKAARVGFDWPGADECIDKLHEELEELKSARAKQSPSQGEIQEEIGDLLFVMVNLARLLKVDPESALKGANRKFRRRFQHIERAINSQGRTLGESNLSEMDRYWEEAKQLERETGK